ncbi:MAG: hypothetical protein NC915_03670 [Candidatus Omnitrophica bacterium]|nr:hypothetical protein [Candidatus Omnitrophota bacterium]
MKKLLIFLILGFPYVLFSQVYYNFQKSKPINYYFQLDGKGSLIYPGVQEEKFNVSVKGNLKIEMVEFENDVYTLKITPLKTIVKLNEQIVEDMTKSDIESSSIISTYEVKMKKNGQIVEMNEIKKGILTLSQILFLLPMFPEGLSPDKKWKQKISAFELPGIPMCGLEFEYSYEKKDDLSEILLFANQSIKETKKDRDINITFTGKNNSKGKFSFNEKDGEITDFNGNFSLDLNIKYEIPSPINKKIEKISTKINLNLNAQFSKFPSQSN